MPRKTALIAAVPILLAIGLLAAPAGARSTPPPPDEEVVDAPPEATVDGFIVHLESSSTTDATVEAETEQALADATTEDDVEADVENRTSTGAAVVALSEPLSADEANAAMDELLADTRVAAVEPDLMLQAVFTPNDPRYAEQWDLHESTGGIRLPAAIDAAANDGAGSVVAVIDTGITSHPDLNANVIAGYDFITSTSTANDGNGRDADASDPGDWNTLFQCLPNPARNSSWHGTHVAGTIAAVTANSTGVVGIAPNADIQPVRVLGRCGGSTADIADAIVWASGGSVAGVPANPTPADVVNMSLGGSGSCGIAMQSAIDGARSRGTIVVVAAGNSTADASGFTPANCNGVVTVASTNRAGARASYSNFGATVELAAPGGETASSAANGILSTLNSGTQGPGSPSYAFYQGTSMAAPHVAGVAALLRGEAASASVDAVTAAMVSTARAFPGSCSGCGSGIVDAAAALAALVGTPPSTTTTTAPSTTTTAPSTTTTAPSTTTTTVPAGQTYRNDTDVAIPDLSTVTSPISVDRPGTAPSNLRVSVDIAHTYRGDLRVELLAPDGVAFLLHNRTGGSADNLIATYTVNAAGRPAGGTWTLRVRDMAAQDTGTLRSWSITFP